jgi:hypothetical protein
MLDQDAKPWWQSKAVVAGLGILLVTIFKLLGFKLTPVDAQDLAGKAVDVVTLVLGLVAIWGRVSATRRIR